MQTFLKNLMKNSLWVGMPILLQPTAQLYETEGLEGSNVCQR